MAGGWTELLTAKACNASRSPDPDDMELDSSSPGEDDINGEVNNDIAQATQSGVQSTPSFIIGDFLVQGALPYADFRKAIDTALVMHAKKRKVP